MLYPDAISPFADGLNRVVVVMFRAACTSATVMAAGDVLCQAIQSRGGGTDDRDGGSTGRMIPSARDGFSSSDNDASSSSSSNTASSPLSAILGFDHDLARTGRFFIVGAALHGPFFHHAFRGIERVVGSGTCARVVGKKVAFGHTVLFPTYTAGFFFAMAGLEGESMAVGYERLKDKAVDTFVSGTMYWPLANAFNFAYVPKSGRILFLNAAGVAWNAYMSHVVSTCEGSESGKKCDDLLIASSAEK